MINFDEYKGIIRIGARDEFWAFCNYMDFDFFQRRRFLKEVALLLQKVYEEYKKGNAINVAISMPPRSGKSYIVSLFCAWWLGKIPEHAVMRNTCTSHLYEKFSYDVRAILISDKYTDVFPDIKISQNKSALSGWNTNHAKQVSYFGAGVGGTIIGFGANIALTDDLYKSMQDALSENNRESVDSWKQSSHDSRKEKNCPEIYIGTRWTKKDVIGSAIESGKVLPENTIKVSALIEVDGEEKSFCEDVKSTEEYKQIRAEIEDSIWNAEYQQEPVETKGLLFPLSSLRFQDLSNIDYLQAVFSFAIGDPADKGGDFNAMLFCYVMPNIDIIVKRVLFTKDGVEVAAERISEISNELGIEQMIVEANGGWVSFVVLLKKTISENITLIPYTNSVSKIVRILSNYEFVIKHFVFDSNYKYDKDYSDFINNLTSFIKEGTNKNDDAPDVASAAGNFIKIKYKDILYS